RTHKSQGKSPYRATLSTEVRVEEAGWFAARILSTTTNELGYQLFAHTSPVYIELAGKTIFDADSAQALLRQIEEGQAAIAKQGQFSSPQARQELLGLYQAGARVLRLKVGFHDRP